MALKCLKQTCDKQLNSKRSWKSRNTTVLKKGYVTHHWLDEVGTHPISCPKATTTAWPHCEKKKIRCWAGPPAVQTQSTIQSIKKTKQKQQIKYTIKLLYFLPERYFANKFKMLLLVVFFFLKTYFLFFLFFTLIWCLKIVMRFANQCILFSFTTFQHCYK